MPIGILFFMYCTVPDNYLYDYVPEAIIGHKMRHMTEVIYSYEPTQ